MEKRLATSAQINFIVKLQIKTRDKEKIPIPLYMDKAGEMIDRLKLLRENMKKEDKFSNYINTDAANETAYSNYMWGAIYFLQYGCINNYCIYQLKHLLLVCKGKDNEIRKFTISSEVRKGNGGE